MEQKNKKIFFSGLNELRAFAAISVIFHHIELFKNKNGISSLFDTDIFSYFIEKIGKNGVYLFFVLSGFLITYLLIKEKNKLGTILFKNFFLRRIFRIWPLYYFIVLISFIVIPFLAHTFDIFQLTPSYFNRIAEPANYSVKSFLLYLFFLPNVALSLGISVVGASQSWSVGVEEQFYVLWPILVYLFRRNIIWVFGFIILLLASFHFFQIKIISPIFKILPFEFMAIGAIGGYLFYYYNEKIELFSKSKYLYLLLLLLILSFLFIPFFSQYFQNMVLSCLFLFLILMTINNENPMVFRNKYFSFLGQISYGIYMYHPFVMFLLFPIATKYIYPSSFLAYNIFVYLLVISVTILISHISYKYLESTFIKIKDTKYKSL